MNYLRQSTAVTVKLGPFVDSTDGVTAETALTISQADVRLSKNGGDIAQKNQSSAATHDEIGYYDVSLNATDTNTVGELRVMVSESGALPVFRDFQVLEEAVYDRLFETGAAGPTTATEARSITQSASAGLVYTPTNGNTGVADLVGYRPVVGSASYETEVLAVASTWRRLCPATRATEYYFDAQNGNDANSGLTAALPKQTISAMNTLLSAGNVRIYAKGTWRHAASAGVTMPANTSLTRWPDGSNYRITGCRLEADAGSVTWTLGAGNRYSATIANAAHLHPKGWGPFHYLTCAASTAEVEANSFSYFITGSTVHVNMGGTNPNTLDFELTHTSDFGSLASGVTVTGGGVYIEGGTFDHNGYGAYASGTNQSYGILLNQINEEVVYVKDCTVGGHFYHNIGTLSVGGGRSLLENVVAGGCRDDIATHINFFSTNGDNEAIALRCRVVTDRMPRVGMLANNAQEAFYGHTATAGTIAFVSVIAAELTADGQDPAQSLGRFGNTPTPTTNPASYVACFHRCRVSPGVGSRTVPWQNNTAFVACNIAIRPLAATWLGVSVLAGQGLCLNTEYDVDWSSITPGAGGYGLHTSTIAPNVDPHIVNSRIRFRGTQSGLVYSIIRWPNLSGFALDWPGTSGSTSRVINTVFIADAPTTGSTCRIVLGDVLSPSAVFLNNAVFGFAAGGVGEEGYTTWLNTVVLKSPSAMGQIDERLIALGNIANGAIAEMDRLGRPLLTPGADIGPYGLTAGDYDQAWRFSLTPTQLASIEAAATGTPALIVAEMNADTDLDDKIAAAALTVVPQDKVAVSVAADGSDIDLVITASGETITAYSLTLVAITRSSPYVQHTASASGSSAQAVTATIAGQAALVAEDLDIYITVTTTQSGVLPREKIRWRPQAALLAAIEAVTPSETPLAERPSAPNRTRKVRRSITGGLTFDAIVLREGDADAVWCLDFSSDLPQGTGITSVAAPEFDDTGVAATATRTGDRPSKGEILAFDATTAAEYIMTQEVTYGDSQGTQVVEGPVHVKPRTT